jgi:beta-glucanase (GH16 family)
MNNVAPKLSLRFKAGIKQLPAKRVTAVGIVIAFGVIGSILLSSSKAASPVSSVEAENGTLGTVATTVTDSTASGGHSVKFGGASGGAGTTCTVGQAPGAGNCIASPAPTLAGKSWKVIFNDDFNGTSYDPTKWTPCFDWNYGDCTGTFNNGRERYKPSQVQLSGGIAHLVAEPMSPPEANSGCYTGSCTYKAGLISTARPNAGNGSGYLFPFTYGYVEAKMKYPAVSGMFTAFWMLPTDPSYDYRSEIDIAEILGGEPDTIFMTYHPPPSRSGDSINTGEHNNAACPVKDYSKDWVRIGMDWEPNYIAWYIDGVKCGQRNSSQMQIENGPMQLILHMMVDNNWERSWGMTLPNQQTTASLDVDYVHIYQLQ